MAASLTLRPQPAAATVGGAADVADVAARALVVARRTALGVLGDREAAADVAQEVAIVAVRHARRLRDPAAFEAWLHRVAVRAALKEARRGHRRRTAEAAHHALRRSGSASGGDGLDTALALLEGLPDRQRAALTLRYVHDLPDAAIARALGCRPGTVRSLLSRGRDALRARPSADQELPHDLV